MGILQVSSATQLRSEDVINWTSERSNILKEDAVHVPLQDHNYFPDPTEPSVFGARVVVYIAGHIARYLQGYLKCEICISVLTVATPRSLHSLLQQKDYYGDFLYPSNDVIYICRFCEKVLRVTLAECCISSLSSTCSMQKMMLQVVEAAVERGTFRTLREIHMVDQTPLENHYFHLIKCITQKYLDIRMIHIARTRTEEIHKVRCRQLFTKLTQFKGE